MNKILDGNWILEGAKEREREKREREREIGLHVVASVGSFTSLIIFPVTMEAI